MFKDGIAKLHAKFIATEKLAFSKYPTVYKFEANHGVNVGIEYSYNEHATKNSFPLHTVLLVGDILKKVIHSAKQESCFQLEEAGLSRNKLTNSCFLKKKN